MSQSSPNVSVQIKEKAKESASKVTSEVVKPKPKLMHEDLFDDDDFEEVPAKLERLITVLKVAIVKLQKEDRKLVLHSE